ncbi:hypothetical protein [Sphingobium yanoikuyae]|jgi:hypothetical protein|uniref:Uncharacterized protein n=2 Tax=Sphingobium TaxID=165695 RepID=A0A084E8W9_SPHYA|nr:hypothetical protein [Sphingobium yanoikuyae]AYO78767.1 hypothetical protein EBF16_18840 [Sphingobium yanoikuyae]KEZ14411.1 hypothetical protein CP98_04884 [Sphingobium yanoikuyae]QJR04055.1 hypothetical protein HH800_18745 [Sphingobium yanoikuyae]QNG45186.1 hypothetical protein H3V42_25760 [Sphingobium yanoikuyae]
MGKPEIHAIFERVFGRSMSEHDHLAFSQMFAAGSPELLESQSYVAEVVVSYFQLEQLRTTVENASQQILANVQQDSEAAVRAMVQDAIKRIHASAPQSSVAFYRATIFYAFFSIFAAFAAVMAVYGTLSCGWMIPPWLDAREQGKVEFAEKFAQASGRRWDWNRVAIAHDPSVSEVLRIAADYREGRDPYADLRSTGACKAAGHRVTVVSGNRFCRVQISR